jgi:chromosome segregation protein
MLKRLDLIGFKSFADSTRFDFPIGITAIVGPNGSGKSNIVDAVRWILGEQSAKSLRGGEMADVIFNGSTSRKSLGMAEVTMTFDNSRRSLSIEADEVHITRRVYRDGTGEYLINHQISRLKDIKEMFLGSGAGTSAYSIIEQGRVDALLQASTRDRRTIFEEAAGISRFKAKKVETLRKLEHVEQNLARVRDIVAEVEKQRRRLDIEASKARRFQEYSTRLKELRIGVGLREYGHFTDRIGVESKALEELRLSLGQIQTQLDSWETEAAAKEQALAIVEHELEAVTSRRTEALRNISTLSASLEHERQNSETSEKEQRANQLRKLELANRLRNSASAVQQAEVDLREAETQAETGRQHAQKQADALLAVNQLLAGLQRQVQQDRLNQVDLVRQAGTLQTQTEAAKQQLDRMYREREQRRRRSEQKQAELGSLDRVLEELTLTDADLQLRLAIVRSNLTEKITEQDEIRRQLQRHQQDLETLRVRRSELRGRIEILEGLERSQEGLGTGVREVVSLLKVEAGNKAPRSKANLLSSTVIGLVADFLSVPGEVAHLIDLALGDTAQRFVVRDAAALDRILAAREKPFSGRVGFIPILSLDPLAEGDETSTADRWVTCDHPELAGLPRQLLGNVRIVPDLAAARADALDPEFQGFRFVTKQGEVLEPDGTLTLGKHHSEGGILSRKSELRDLRAKAKGLEKDVVEAEQELNRLQKAIDDLDAPIHGLEQEIELLTNEAGDLQTRLVQHREQRMRIGDEIEVSRIEMKTLEQEIQTGEASWKSSREKAEQAERAAEDLKLRLAEAEQAIQVQEQERVRHQQESTAAQVALAQMEERLGSLRAQFHGLEGDLRRGRDEIDRVERHELVLQARLVEIALAMLRAGAALAQSYSEKETSEHAIAELSAARDVDRDRRKFLMEQLNSVRASSKVQLAELHKHELAVRDVENARTALIDRLREDYVIDLAAEFAATREQPDLIGETSAANVEIGQLKEKVRRLGNVSLESLQELADVEARAKDLQAQLDDLSSAHGSLLEIISKINTDSRKLFTELYEHVRTHFQELFRKLFGGGMADVVLENPDDVLESGIEIVARPPGKELRSISLMSGGEKTLTAVALLLAIFQSKPSPFCLLDEVDAALDEANTARLGTVLREFLDRSQFIIITHKKRTMAIADVLYGITMQESGVSKQVAVRFEDWPEDQPTAA